MVVEPRGGLTVIVKTTHDCNLDCLYCYTNPDAEEGMMNLETLEDMIRKVSEYNKSNRSVDNTVLIWHGGEPLLLGPEFYKKAVAIQKTIDGHIFQNDVQTNGTLLTPKFFDFFEENHFDVGLSLDGPAKIHDVNRPYKDGSSSFDDVFYKALELKKRNLGGGAICVLNKKTESHLEEIYDFFKQNQIHLKVNIQMPAGRALNDLELGLSPKVFGEAMVRLFDLWFYDEQEPLIRIDPFTHIMGNIGAYRNKKNKLDYPIGCNFGNDCANSFISIVPGGNVYPCGRFAGNPNFYMGNITTDPMTKIMASKSRQPFLQRQEEGVESCTPCEYKPVCNSGCPDHAYLMRGSILKKDGFCIGYKKMFGHIEQTMKKTLEVK